MTAGSIYAIAALIGLGAFLMAAQALIGRGETRLGGGPPDHHHPGPPPDEDDQVSAYLGRMTADLALPAADVADVRAEVGDHLRDTIASLEAGGLGHHTAVAEAIGRLGPPTELADQLRAADQTTRRMLAGAAGGVFAAGGSFMGAYIVGGLLITLLAAGAFCLSNALASIGLRIPDLAHDPEGLSRNALLIGLTTAIAAAAATRYAVRTSAGLGRRLPRSVAVLWAAVGGLAFGWWALVGLRGHQNWLIVAVELLIPVAAVAGALVRIERPMPGLGRSALAVIVVAMVALPLGLVVFAAGSGSGSASNSVAEPATEFQFSDLHFDSVGPAAPRTWIPDGWRFEGGDTGRNPSEGFEISETLQSNGPQSTPPPTLSSVLANWRDLRFEAWHGVEPELLGPGGVDTRYSSPFGVQPAVLDTEVLRAEFHFEKLRDAEGAWYVFLTGVAPDGIRYRLDDGSSGSSDFFGSAWDWLTAPQ